LTISSSKENAIQNNTEALNIGALQQTGDDHHIQPTLADLQKFALALREQTARANQNNELGINFLIMPSPFEPVAATNIPPKTSHDQSLYPATVQGKWSPFQELAKQIAADNAVDKKGVHVHVDAQKTGKNQPEDKIQMLAATSASPVESGRNVPVKPNGTVEREGEKQHQQKEKTNAGRADEVAEHRKLEKEADKLQEPERSQFKKDMKDFEARAAKDGLSPAEVIETYKQLERMMEAQGDKPLSEEERLRVAAQVMHRAANPTETNQASHNTCSVASLEVRTYSKHPSDAAKLVADVSLTGQYIAKDGTVVHQAPNYHGGLGSKYPRDHASEIFQVTAVNIHYAQENAKTNPPGQIRYVQTTLDSPHDPNDTGERIKDFSKNPPNGEDVQRDGKVLSRPDLTDNDLCGISQAITGLNEKGMLFATPEGIAGNENDDHIVTVHSEAELEKKLAEAKANGQLPIIVHVFANNEPFYTDENHQEMTQDPGAHCVTISDYEPGPPAVVKMNNQWGPQSCHGVSVHDLYRAMKPPTASIDDLQKDVDWNRAHNQVDYQKEFELLNLKKVNGQIDEVDYEKQTEVLIAGLKKHFEQDNPSAQERTRDIQKMADAINELPLDVEVGLYTEAFKDGIMAPNAYYYALELVGWRAHRNYSHISQNTDPDERAKLSREYEAATLALNRAVEELPEAERLKIFETIKDLNNK
jgi:hypothetical protein